jgi:uncharacterized membrane protein YphA (DoxX/SURF4 family)
MQFAIATTNTTRPSSRFSGNRRLWAAQGVLGALFLFAGVMKLVTPAAEMADQSGMPALFLEFIGVCEALGGAALVLPGLLRTARGLTWLAAAGLSIIMAGAVVTSIAQGAGVLAVFPLAVLASTLYVARGRFTPRILE